MSLIAVYIPCGSDAEANKIAEHLLGKKLIACANIWPIRSLYNWGGELADEAEYVIFAKTKESAYNEIISEVEQIHSNDIPAIVKIKIEVNKNYEKWLKQEVQKE